MCTNSSGSLLAVVGRKGLYCVSKKKLIFDIHSIYHSNLIVFKILKIFPDQIQIYLDLRDLPGKQLNLNFSNNDVQWNPKDGEMILRIITCVPWTENMLWYFTRHTILHVCNIVVACMQNHSLPLLLLMAVLFFGILLREPNQKLVCKIVVLEIYLCILLYMIMFM